MELPTGQMPEMEFFDMMVEAGPEHDVMDFQLSKSNADPELLFSGDGVHTVARQIERYLLARTLARYTREGVAPGKLVAKVSLEWDKDSAKWDAWYDLPDPGDAAIDGSLRAAAVRRAAEKVD